MLLLILLVGFTLLLANIFSPVVRVSGLPCVLFLHYIHNHLESRPGAPFLHDVLEIIRKLGENTLQDFTSFKIHQTVAASHDPVAFQ